MKENKKTLYVFWSAIFWASPCLMQLNKIKSYYFVNMSISLKCVHAFPKQNCIVIRPKNEVDNCSSSHGNLAFLILCMSPYNKIHKEVNSSVSMRNGQNEWWRAKRPTTWSAFYEVLDSTLPYFYYFKSLCVENLGCRCT